MNVTFLLSLVLITLAAGCASNGGSHKLVSAPMSSTQAGKYTDLMVSVQAAPHVALSQSDRFRMTNLIAEDVNFDAPNRFKAINPLVPNSTILQASVVIKRYDEGDAFYRLMLMGLGQIHIDADVVLADSATKNQLAQYEVTKTFAWGGYFGALIGIKDVEVGFCKAVADSILGND
ncbi:MAG: hypothetical protein CTY16_19175 [Methylobacter sp.]|nr:MAG: hypothetical protein CTY16_19175 [Methylobacter sp.]